MPKDVQRCDQVTPLQMNFTNSSLRICKKPISYDSDPYLHKFSKWTSSESPFTEIPSIVRKQSHKDDDTLFVTIPFNGVVCLE